MGPGPASVTAPRTGGDDASPAVAAGPDMAGRDNQSTAFFVTAGIERLDDAMRRLPTTAAIIDRKLGAFMY